MSHQDLLSDAERTRLTRVLSSWGLAPKEIINLLHDAVFPPGISGGKPEGMEPFVAIMIDQTRDPGLAHLFEWRAGRDDLAFAAEWKTGAGSQARTILSPRAPEALFAYTIDITSPAPFRRTYLILVSKQANVLSLLLKPGTSIWLVPQPAAVTEWAKEGTGTAYDLLATALPVGVVQAPPVALRQALEHVGHIPPGRG
jgi:hypothetical protein